jgi:hypothetical protein
MAASPMPGAGDVTFDLAGETITLKCSPQAALTLSREPGAIYGSANVQGVVDRVLACNLDTLCVVIRAGLGLGPGAVTGLPEKVYATGLLNVRAAVLPFIGALANGGQPIGLGGEATGEENPPNG